MRKRIVIIVLSAAALLITPMVVYASHQFNDVPDSNIFHNDISWLANNGITTGCGDGTNFCPEDNVTRQQMAAFLRRFHDTFISAGGPAVGLGASYRLNIDPPSAGNGVIPGLSMNLNIPEAGVLLVEGSVDMSNEIEPDAFACGINAGYAVDLAEGDSWRAVDLTANFYDTCSTLTAFNVSPGSQVVRVVVVGALPTTQAYGGVIQAVLYTGDGVYGLLDASPQATNPRALSDTRKGSS